MGIPQQNPVTREMQKMHQKSIDVCRGIVCVEEIGRVFDTKESNALERIIDGKEPRRNALGEAQWSRKYDRYPKGSIPNDETLAKIRDKAAKLQKAEYVKCWRDLAMWDLAKEPVISLERIREAFELMPSDIKRLLFHMEDFETPKAPFSQTFIDKIIATAPLEIRKARLEIEANIRQFRPLRRDFSPSLTLRLRDTLSLQGFIALLALAREAETLEEYSKHQNAARCAFELFPVLLLENPHLYACRKTLFNVLKLAIWDRELHGGGRILSIYTFDKVEKCIETYSRDKNAKFPLTTGAMQLLSKDNC